MKKIFIPLIMIIISLILFSCSDTTIVPSYVGSTIVEESVNNDNTNKPNNEFDYSTIIPDIVINSDVTYFASSNSKVKVKIELNNPSQFEILSLTINEKKYQTFEFAEGSNSQLIYVEILTPNISGEYQYNIDNIKYIDGKEIKDVDMSNASKIIKLGITYDKLPTINVSNKLFTKNSYSLNVEVIDEQEILAKTSGIKAYLFDDAKKIVTSFKLDSNILTFDNLKESQDYHLVLAVGIDLLDGNGGKTHILYEEDFTTKSNAYFSNIESGYDFIKYNVVTENDKTKIDSIKLIDLTTNNEIDVTNLLEINNLLSNRKYKLVLTYTYLNNQYTSTALINTKAYSEVKINSFNLTVKNNVLNFDYSLFDKDNRITKTEVVILKNDVVVKVVDPKKVNSITLEFNTNYKVCLNVYYDLGDGEKERKLTNEQVITTPKEKPTMSYQIVSITNNSISLNIIEKDDNNIGEVKVIQLLDDKDNLIKELPSTNSFIFDNLTSNKTYKVKTIYSYDINDGNGKVEVEYINLFQTHKREPQLNVDYTFDTNKLTINLDKTIDLDNAGKVSNIKLLLQGVVVNEGLGLEYLDLLSNTTYDLEVYYTYNLNDGAGDKVKKFSSSFKTLSYQFSLNYSNLKSTKDSISFDLDVLDESNSFKVNKIDVYDNNNIVLTKNDILTFKNITINNLTPNINYKVVVTYSYNLNDGNGIQTETLEFSYPTTSGQSIEVISVENVNAIVSGSNIDIRIFINNPLNLNIDAIYIDDVKYDIAHNYNDSVVITLIPDILAGIYKVNITGYSYTINNISMYETLKNSYVHEINIIPDLNIISFGSINNEHYVNYGMPEISLKFDGSTGLEIVSFETNEKIYNKNDFNVINNNEIRFSSNIYPLNTIILKSVTYALGQTSKTVNVNLVGDFYVVMNNQILNISNASDFSSLESDRVYQLTNDIDFKGVSHNPIDFSGVILGNNFKILNFNLNVTSSNLADEYGLFTNFKGYIGNLTFDSPYINVSTSTGSSMVGVLAGASQNSYFENINIINATIITDGYAGGLVGQLGITDSYYAVSNVKVSGSISGGCDTGGLSGQSNGFADIARFVNNADINSKKNVGGILATHNGDLKLSNSLNGGKISSTGFLTSIAGLIGRITSSNANIENVLNSGVVSEDFFGDSCGIIGKIQGTCIVNNSVSVGAFGQTNDAFKNCYATVNQDVNVNIVKEEVLHTKDFWVKLEFDSKIWDLDNLLNSYPTLK